MGSNVLIIGAARGGIGEALADAYLERGDFVIVASRSVQSTSDSRRKFPGKLVAIPFDIRGAQEPSRLVSIAETHVSHVDILVNCTGVSRRTSDHASVSNAQWSRDAMQDMLNVNAIGPYLLGLATKALLLAAERPRLINLTSRSAFPYPARGAQGDPSYAASKAALNAYTWKLAFDPSWSKVVVVAVDPGHVTTRLTNFEGDRTPVAVASDLVALVDSLSSAVSGQLLRLHATGWAPYTVSIPEEP
jgi:NAD(P)-dependent dehydrogenase (short-subunit alcohol dehydrogenase family)